MSRDGGLSPTAERDLDRLEYRWTRPARPVGLSERMVERTGQMRSGDPVPVDVMVPVYYTYVDDVLAQGEAIAWTDTAVLVRVSLPDHDEPVKVWVWAAAVKRVDRR